MLAWLYLCSRLEPKSNLEIGKCKLMLPVESLAQSVMKCQTVVGFVLLILDLILVVSVAVVVVD